MQGIYTYIPETNHVPKEYNFAAILSLLFMVPISLAPALALMYFYIKIIIIIIIIIIYHCYDGYSPFGAVPLEFSEILDHEEESRKRQIQY
jgi:hypothetical protein